jgi:HK97 gp10 family phage protein
MATRRRLGGRILTKKALTLEGIPEVAANANKLMRQCGYGGAEIAQELKRGLMKGALMIRDEARDLVPVDTGLLKQSIFAAYGDRKKTDVLVGVNTRQAVATTQAGVTRTYAGVVEFGDDYRAPHPYMRPGIQAARPSVARIVKEEISAAIEKLAGK